MTSALGTAELMLAVIPDGEPLKGDLQQWHDGIFMEGPEHTNFFMRQLFGVLQKHLPEGGYKDLNGWQKQLALIWNESQKRKPYEPTKDT